MANTATYTITRATPDDIPAIGSLVYTSKQILTINRVLFVDWPNEAAQRPVYGNAVETSFKDPTIERWKAVDDKTGELIGYVVFTRKQPTKKLDAVEKGNESVKEGGVDEVKVEENEGFPPGMVPAVARAVGEACQELDEQYAKVDHISLIHLYVTVPHRNKGIGKQLMKLCIDKAKEVGLPLVLNSEPQVRGFLLKLGFKDTKHADFDLTKWAEPYCGFGTFRLWGMVLE